MIGKYAAFAAGMAGVGLLWELSKGDWLSGGILLALTITCVAVAGEAE